MSLFSTMRMRGSTSGLLILRDLGVYSLQGTGTRFVVAFFADQGVEVPFRHLGQNLADRPIYPVRNPYDCYLSHRSRKEVDELQFVARWGQYIAETARKVGFYFALDTGEREPMLSRLCEYAGLTPDRDRLRAFAADWTPVGATRPKDNRPIPKRMLQALNFAHDWYLYFTPRYGIN